MIDEKKLLNEMIDLLAKHCKDMKLVGKIVGLIDTQPTVQPQGIDKDRLIDTAEAIIEVLEGVIEDAKQIPSQPTSDGWIPVSSGKLPTEEGAYWVTDGWGDVKTVFVPYNPKTNGTFEEHLKLYGLDITAWMPAILPQPYKESEKECLLKR